MTTYQTSSGKELSPLVQDFIACVIANVLQSYSPYLARALQKYVPSLSYSPHKYQKTSVMIETTVEARAIGYGYIFPSSKYAPLQLQHPQNS
jgi:hypothetical protein